MSLVDRCCQSLKEGFKSSWWLPNGHAQTIYSAMADFSKDDQITYQRQLLRVPDGGTIGLDIYPPLSVNLPSNAPVILINHGLTGGSHESYVRNMVVWLTKPVSEGGLGGRAAVVNFRGCASTPLTSPHLYSTGSTIDLHTSVLYLSTLFPFAPMFGVGFSLGAAVMTRYLGEQGDRCRLRAGVVLCCPLDMRVVTYGLDSPHPLTRIYSLSMADKILRSISPHLIPSSPLSHPTSHLHIHLPEIMSLTKSVWRRATLKASKMLELVACTVGGGSDLFPFDTLDGFLSWSCPGNWIGAIKRPTLAISALDDPIVSSACLPYKAIRRSTHCVLATVSQGGHLGWFEGPPFGKDKHKRWHVKPTIEFFQGILDLPCNMSSPTKDTGRRVGDWTWVGDVGWMVLDEMDEKGWSGNEEGENNERQREGQAIVPV
nr:anon-23da protein [Kwoniella dejecticola CBS 10117]OBR85048.1 anon-23da protein [Kwoniella dejecticola CBS 10117]